MFMLGMFTNHSIKNLRLNICLDKKFINENKNHFINLYTNIYLLNYIMSHGPSSDNLALYKKET